ncbi:hypothetical protein ACQUQU_11430 [Thalassolituus sp. LLYu03]|uniref:hypothetical protein n=1 Tax=Thalassolituus sp. LLYu03 TaxID=3421656 RepID=UPI003D2E3478
MTLSVVDRSKNELLIQQILSCEDLCVVLRNRYGDEYVESYQLPVVMLSGDRFWAKFHNVHPIDSGVNDVLIPGVGAYAYNNYCKVVACCYMSQTMERYYSSDAYSSVVFRCRGQYEKVWSSEYESDFDSLRRAVLDGRRVKIKIEDNDSYTYIMLCHTIEVYDDKFSLETEFDAIPMRLRFFSYFEDLEAQFAAVEAEYTAPNYPATNYAKTQFYTLNFLFHSDGNHLVRRFFGEAGSPFSGSKMGYQRVELWVEC